MAAMADRQRPDAGDALAAGWAPGSVRDGKQPDFTERLDDGTNLAFTFVRGRTCLIHVKMPVERFVRETSQLFIGEDKAAELLISAPGNRNTKDHNRLVRLGWVSDNE